MRKVQVEVRRNGKIVSTKSVVVTPLLRRDERTYLRGETVLPAFMLRDLPMPSQGSFCRHGRRPGNY